MPTLAELKAKWFLTMSGDVLGVPQTRHAGSGAIAVSTDGNTVTPLIDGQAYMARWHAAVSGAASGGEVYHAGWRLEAVEPLGVGTGPTALTDLKTAQTAGATPYVLLSEHVGSIATNGLSITQLRANGLWTACRDNRYPAAGSNHQKMALFKGAATPAAVLGSIDLSLTRWDTPSHASSDPRRPGNPTHDTGVWIEGPALADLDLCFRERWNDSTRTFGMTPLLPPQPLISTPVAGGAASGGHAVQVLRTYGQTSARSGYSWSPSGEFTAWAAYLNAIQQAASYIYIEDQYFLAWDFPPRYARPAGAAGREVDVVYQLGEAMKRGVQVVVVTPSNAEDSTHMYQKYQRDLGVNYLMSVRASGAAGDVVVASLQNGTDDVYVHSKLMLVDDELTLIGSANIGQRSMAYDGEIHVAVVDVAGAFARDFRKALWAEHTGRSAASLHAPAAAIALFKADTAASAGHLKSYPVDPLSVFPPRPGSKAPPAGHATALKNLIDPYAGPPALA